MMSQKLVCRLRGVLLLAVTAVLFAGPAQAEDWPTYRHDVSRTGTTAELLDAARLAEAWVHSAAEAPLPAWPGPARWDAYAAIKDLPSMRNYDPCYHTVAVGGAVYFGSSTDDSVYKLDAASGEVVWTYTTGGPVRIAPMVHGGKVYFGSDDGAAYCVDAETGEEVWRYDVTPGERMVMNNGRAIAFHPVRTGVVVRDGVAYFGASLLPWKESYLVGVDAQTGKVEGAGTFRQRVEGQTMEGAMLATQDELILPQGRVAPMRFTRATGAAAGSLGGGGGVFVVITEDQHILRQGQARAGGLVGNDQIAQYSRGHALVVAGDYGFLLDLESVIGLDMKEGQELWRHKLESPADLLLAGDTLYVGSRGAVTAYNAVAGTQVWSAQVDGPAHGLVVANGALVVSTDTGAIHCFREGAGSAPGRGVAVEEGGDASGGDGVVAESPEVEAVRARGLVGRWVFHRSAMRDADGASVDADTFRDVAIRDQARQLHGRLVGNGTTERINNIEAMVFDGNTLVELATDPRRANLPQRQFSVEAWVRVDEAMAWGGIVGCIRDNGNDEQGWLLGFRDDKFCLGLRTEDGGSLTYMTANNTFTPGGWAHVVGTYDGETMRLYVNGRFEVSSDAQGGDITYPDAVNYVIGAYKDENEDFRLKGLIHEVRVYTNVLRDRDVTALFRAKAENFPEPEQTTEEGGNFLAFGPYLRFTAPGEAVVRWSTDRPTTGSITFVRDDETITVESDGRGTDHEVTVTGLQPRAVYQYQVTAKVGSAERTTRSFECDTFFNYQSAGLTSWEQGEGVSGPEYESLVSAAELTHSHIADELGFLVVFGSPDARFAEALAAEGDLNVVCLMDDEAAVAAERERLVSQGVYGRRITLLHVGDPSQMQLPALFANAAVLDPRTEGDGAESSAWAKQLLQPGGVYVVAYAVVWTAPPIEGAGDWGHMYGSADNSSFGGESIAGAASTDDLEVQWVGRPGPRYQSDRQTRKPAPLAAGGRLYMQGLWRIICCDQYNGTILWSIELPEMMRWNVTRDSANWCADDAYLYVAVLDEMLKIDGRTGEIVERFRAHGNRTAERTWDWGYIARAGQSDELPGVLLGSSVKPGSVYTDWWTGTNWYDQQDGELAAKVASDVLFAVDPETGRERWNRREGLVINPTITVGEDEDGNAIVYFVESRNPAIVRGDTRRLQSDEVWQGLHLVGVNAMTGREVLDKPIEPMAGTTAFYLVYSQGKLLLSSSSGNQFALYAMEADDASPVWDTQFAWQANHHGKHLARPAVVGNLVFLRPKVMDLDTGSMFDLDFPDGHQCGTYTLTTNALFARAGDTMMWSVNDQQISRFNRHRPDCWISTIPAGGMVLSPEGGGGCSCGSWIETSLGWMPKATSEQAGQEGNGAPGE